jgi:hypothetical protein
MSTVHQVQSVSEERYAIQPVPQPTNTVNYVSVPMQPQQQQMVQPTPIAFVTPQPVVQPQPTVLQPIIISQPSDTNINRASNEHLSSTNPSNSQEGPNFTVTTATLGNLYPFVSLLNL